MIKRLLFFIFLFSAPAFSQTAAVPGFCDSGAHKALTSNLPSSNYQQQLIPKCLVTVYLSKTTTKATIFKDGSGTVLTNPFQANPDASWIFFAAINQAYDIVLSGPPNGVAPNVYPIPRTIVGRYPSTQIINTGSGTVNLGIIGDVPYYRGSGSAISPSNITIDTNGNNLNIPGTVSAGTTVSAPTVTVTGTPTNPTDAATVAYVGSHSGSSGPPLTATSSSVWGVTCAGDSITLGIGASVNYCNLMNVDFGVGGVYSNIAVSGDNSQDMANHLFTSVNPNETQNPIVTEMVGTNDASRFGVTANALQTYSMTQYANMIWPSAAPSIKVLVGSALVTQAGTWVADTTFPNANGLSSTVNGSTLTFGGTFPQGIFYLLYRDFQTSGGTFTVTIDGVAATDTVRGLTTLISQTPFAVFPSSNGATSSEAAARFVTTPGTHFVVITVTSATSGANTVVPLGFVVPTVSRTRGLTGPNVYVGGVPYQLNDAVSGPTATYNGLNMSIAAQLLADGMKVVPVNVRAYINSTIDLSGSATQNCPASGSPPMHPNNCGQIHVKTAFEDYINAGNSLPVYNSAPVNLLNGTTVMGNVGGNDVLNAAFCPSGGSGGFAWCITTLQHNSVYYNTLTTNNNSGGIAFSFVPGNATGAQVGAAIFDFWKFDGSFYQNKGLFQQNALGKATLRLNAVPADVNGYHDFSNGVISTTSLLNGIIIGNTGTPDGWQELYQPGGSTYAVGWFASSNHNICNFFYVPPASSATSQSSFTCPSFFSSDGLAHAIGAQLTGLTTPGVVINNSGGLLGTTPLSGGGPQVQSALAAGVPTYTPGTNVTSCVRSGSVTNSNTYGEIVVVGGTATTGVICTINFSTTLAAAPKFCMVSQNSFGVSPNVISVGHGVATATSLDITAGLTVAGLSVSVNYLCLP